jgi:2-C-methyl-D-erythritol 4-phosphate cytidylyltransferase/2-C-methyl-D-erythritol 2,4-cyclodiphosphate synthase
LDQDFSGYPPFETTAKKTVAVIVVAAGKGERVARDGDPTPKQYRLLAGQPVLKQTLGALLGVPVVDWILPVIHADHAEPYAELGIASSRLLPPVAGGATRQASVLAGLEGLVALRPDIVLIHDAARPFVDAALVDSVVDALASHAGALPALPVTDTIKRAPDGQRVVATEDRRELFAAQTPQGFRFDAILAAHRQAAAQPHEFTDDAAIAEWAGLDVALVPGSTRNFKLTHAEDFSRAQRLFSGETMMETRIGSGYDVHSFEPGDAVWLGGVEIPHKAKLNGHSDADVALHALTDAIYGALGEGDIGTFFPPSDPQWKGAASRIFLTHAAGLVARRRGRIVNLDITIVCEAPKIAPHVAAMRAAIADACGIAASRVTIKATTNERLGFIGREEGIVAMATASIELPRED